MPTRNVHESSIRIATHHVNGVNGGLPVLLEWHATTAPDVVCLQKLKAAPDNFPRPAIEAAGYDAIWLGQKSSTGVPLVWLSLVRQHPDVEFGKAFWLFALVIPSCGFTHVMGIWNLWHGDYGVGAVVKAVTALATVPTAILLCPLSPKPSELAAAVEAMFSAPRSPPEALPATAPRSARSGRWGRAADPIR